MRRNKVTSSRKEEKCRIQIYTCYFVTYVTIVEKLLHFPRFENSEHCLSHVKSVSPIMIFDWSVVLLNTQDPATKNLHEQITNKGLILCVMGFMSKFQSQSS